ncbi:MAG: HNH endonuclease signature motif containing protein [Promethearchaeota archaeon]
MANKRKNTAITFNRERFNKNKRTGYWCRAGGGKFLHRAIWEFYNGKIPEGYTIHHKDGNKSNNELSNLQLLSYKEHSKKHWTRERANKQKEWINKIRPLTKEWHRSEEGRKWHSKHWKNSIGKNFKEKTFICEICGKEFKSFTTRKQVRFCSQKCRQKDFRIKFPEKVKEYQRKSL